MLKGAKLLRKVRRLYYLIAESHVGRARFYFKTPPRLAEVGRFRIGEEKETMRRIMNEPVTLVTYTYTRGTLGMYN